jgi:chemotaxis protein methyltransferase CheR
MRDPQLEELEIRLFLEAINARYGYDFRDYASPSIHRRVRAALLRSGAANLGELQHRVLYSQEQFTAVLGALTIQVTELFRDPQFYLAFREQVVPILKTYPQVKIWNAGCATGEEVYSVSVLVQEEGLADRVQIYATDLNESALEQAREGVYPEAQLRDVAGTYRATGGKRPFESYVTRAYGNLTFIEAVRKNIVFFQHDLVSDFAPGEMQVILCRNVLIYFNALLRARVIGSFAEALCHRGFLCLGRNETLPLDVESGFVPFAREQRIYRLEAA